jgi:hypothetical protein
MSSSLPPDLLSAALRTRWAHGSSDRAAGVLAGQVPGFTADEYTEAFRLADALNATAYALAAAWFDGHGAGPYPSAEELADLHPGFAPDDYVEAIRNNVLWARK